MKTLKRTWADISLDNLEYNYRSIRAHLPQGTKFLGVMKADAYGHGAVPVSRALADLGAEYLAVSNLEEAVQIRRGEVRLPILILGYTFPYCYEELIREEIRPAVYRRDTVEELAAAAAKVGKKAKVHIKVDTGMGRIGITPDDEGIEFVRFVMEHPELEVEGIFTHFAVSDEPGDACKAYTEHQFQLFTDVIKSVEEKLGRRFAIRHCANTGAVARYPETWLDMVRPGLLLYGYGEFADELGLQPVMSLKTTVSTIKTYPAGTAISYGGIYVTDKTTRMGVIPYGYADGFFRALSNRCTLMSEEGPVYQRGKICMDMCMIDLTDKMQVDVGSEIEIFGKKNSINVMAALANTIPYELTCAVSKRVPRFYYRNGKMIEKELLLRG